MFPHVNIITEVTEAANMRFMHFKAKDTYMLQIRQLEKVRNTTTKWTMIFDAVNNAQTT